MARSTVVHGIEALRPDLGRLFLVVGVFDGLHLGHDYLLRHLRDAAMSRAARPSVLTFDHHPDEILVGTAPPLLCDPDQRLALLAQAGVEVTIVQTFDAALRMTPFDVFIRTIAARVDLAGFLMTPDAAFGHERRGTPESVAALGESMGYDVVVVPAMDLAGQPVRSGAIRAAIAAGDLHRAAAMLGRPYSVRGVVAGHLTHSEAPRLKPGEPTAEPIGGRITPGGPRLGADSASIRFATPVALPPAGAYSVRVAAEPDEAAVASAATPGDAPAATPADTPAQNRVGVAHVVSDGSVVVPWSLVPAPGGLVRVSFEP